MASNIRQNFNEESELTLNKMINLELQSSYVYLALAFHFDRDDVALPGFHKFFIEKSHGKRKEAELLMKLQNERGGRIVLRDVKQPPKDDWGNGIEALKAVLDLEKVHNQDYLSFHGVAEKHGDKHLADFIEGNFLQQQVDSIKTLGTHIRNLERVKTGLGEYMFDKETLQS